MLPLPVIVVAIVIAIVISWIFVQIKWPWITPILFATLAGANTLLALSIHQFNVPSSIYGVPINTVAVRTALAVFWLIVAVDAQRKLVVNAQKE